MAGTLTLTNVNISVYVMIFLDTIIFVSKSTLSCYVILKIVIIFRHDLFFLNI